MMKLVTLCGAVLVATNALAALPVQKLTYDQLKEGCKDPNQFQRQNKPANMEVSCEDRQTRWVPVDMGNFTLPRARKVAIGLTSDKFDVPGVTKEVATEQQAGTCPKFKEVIEKIQTTRATNCDEILAFQGTEIQFCSTVMDDMRAKNPESITVSDSGRVVDFCNANLGGNGSNGNGRGGNGSNGKNK